MSAKTKHRNPSQGVDLEDMKAMLQWEATQAGDPVPYPTNAFMMQWLKVNTASASNIQERVERWRQAMNTPSTFIDSDGNKREM